MGTLFSQVSGIMVKRGLGAKRAAKGSPRSRTFELTGRYPGEDEDEDEPLQRARRKKASKRKGKRASKTDRLGG